jgi:DNA polymerase (family 10)
MGEIEAAQSGTLPTLVDDSDIRGIVHCHTDASDGLNTLEEMAEACRAKGMEYFGVADHSQSAFYAGGLKPDRVRQQRGLVESLNRRYAEENTPFRILHGTESDIRSDGSLDFDEETLELFDYIVASIHGQFAMDGVAQTERLIRAASNPFTTILGHMTGRLLLSRPGYEVDTEAVLKACADNGVAVEINANPHRLDVDWRFHRRGLDLGCIFSINPDAHSLSELDHVRWGVLQARKGWIPPDRVLNTMTLDEIMNHLRARRARR